VARTTSPRRSADDRRDDQRGAVAVLVALLMALVLAMAAFTVDLGMQRVLRSDMQAVADAVALDLAWHLDGRSASALTPEVDAAMRQSLARNGASLGDTPAVTYVLGLLTPAGAFDSRLQPAGATTAMAPTAVRVTASSRVDYSFAPGDGAATRSAVAAASASACYQVGSYAGVVRTGSSALLNPVLRRLGQSNAVLAAADYTVLAGASVNLDQLATGLGLASYNELATANVTARSFYTALAASVGSSAGSTTLSVLNALRTWSSTTARIDVGRLLGVTSGSGAVLGATYNVLDLVAGSMFALNGSNVVNAYLGAQLPGTANLGVAIKLGQRAHKYCGRPGTAATTGSGADTEQLGVHVDGSFNPGTATVQVPGIPGLLGSPASLTVHQPNHFGLDLSLAATTATLTKVTCGGASGTTRSATLDVRNGLVTVDLQTPIRTTLRAGLNVGLLGALTQVQVDVNATVRVRATISPSGVTDFTITVPPQQYDTPYATSTGGFSVGTPTVQAGASVSAHVALLNGTLGAWVSLDATQQALLLDSAVKAAVKAYFDASNPTSIASGLINPLLGLAGAEVAGSRVTLESTPPLQCATPALRG